MKRLRYTEGDWFAVPLEDGSYAAVLVARRNRGIALGYFFRVSDSEIPRLGDVNSLEPEQAVWVAIFGDPGIVEGDWPYIGHRAEWNRDAWPMPVFRRRVEPYGTWFRVYYDGDDPAGIGRDVRAGESDVVGLPEDGMAGSEYVKERLSQLLT